METTTLIFPIDEKKGVLLGYKKRGMGKGNWNGFGGKVLKNEDVYEGAKREIYEEANLIVEKEDLELVGFLSFKCPYEKEFDHNGWIFITKKWQGEIKESEEMRPKWFALDEIPYKEMWSTDIKWLHLILRGRKIKGEIIFAKNKKDYLSYKLQEVDNLSIDKE